MLPARCSMMSLTGRFSRAARIDASSAARGVSKWPGRTVFTSTPSFATSSESVLANPSNPLRAVFDRINPGTGCLAAMDVRKMTRPQ